MKTVVWFGNAGAKHGDFGIPNLRIAAPGLAQAAKRTPLKLRVVSNDEAKFAAVTADFPFPCEYRAWSRDGALRDIGGADLCIVPNSRDRFSLAKSANRLVLALSLGVPVVATRTPSAAPLAPFVIFDDWEGGAATYLGDRARAQADVAAAQAFIAAHYAPDRIADQWMGLLHDARPSPASPGASAMAFLATGDDVERFFALQAALERPIAAGMITEILAHRPEALLRLQSRGARIRPLNRIDLMRGRTDLDGLRTLITFDPLGWRYRGLARAAKRAGVATLLAADVMERPELAGAG